MNCLKRLQRFFAGIIAVTFFVTNTLTPVSIAHAADVESAAFISSFTVPAEFGRVTDSVKGSEGAPLLIHVQEAHANYDAQKNIKNILEHLSKNYGVQLFLLEGAGNKLRPELFHFFPKEPGLQQAINEKLMQAGELTGAEVFMMNHENRDSLFGTRDSERTKNLNESRETSSEFRGKAAEAWGVEKAEAYAKNREAFKRVFEGRKLVQDFCETFYRQWQTDASLFMSKPLKEFLTRETAFEEGRLPLEDWMVFLKTAAARHLQLDLDKTQEQRDWPVLVRYFRLKTVAPKIDAAKIRTEKGAFFKEVRKIMSHPSREGDRKASLPSESLLKEVDQIFEQAKKNDLPPYKTRFVFEKLLDQLPEDFSFDAYPDLRLYLQQTILLSELQSETLQDEIKNLTQKLTVHLLETEKDRQLAGILKDFRLVKKLFQLELSRHEYQAILSGRITLEALLRKLQAQDPKAKRQGGGPSLKLLRLQSLYGTAIHFYEGAIERENWMMNKALARMQEHKQKKAVLITGGFHTEGIKEKALRAGNSYVEITPRIGEVAEDSRKNYLTTLLGVKAVETSQIAAVVRSDILFLKDISPNWRRELAEAGANLLENLRQVVSPEKARQTVSDFLANAVGVSAQPQPTQVVTASISKGRSEVRAEKSDGEVALDNARRQIAEVAELIKLDAGLLEWLLSFHRILEVDIPITMDGGRRKIFKGYRSFHNDARGAGKGGVRYSSHVDLQDVKALSMWMTIKNAITGLPYGGGKGGIAVDPRQLSEGELARLTRGYVRALLEKDTSAIGALDDVPAPDVGTSGREMAWMTDEFLKRKYANLFHRTGRFLKEIRAAKDTDTPYLDVYLRDSKQSKFPMVEGSPIAVVTSKPENKGGSLGRTAATGRGVFFTTREALKSFGEKLGIGKEIKGQTVAIQGFGNVGGYAALLFSEAGARVMAVMDVNGTVTSLRETGLNIPKIQKYLEEHKTEKKTITDYAKEFPQEAELITAEKFWSSDVTILVPAALENQIHEANAPLIRAKIIVEGANGPVKSKKAETILEKKGVVVVPDVVANAGGVTVSYLEWRQNLVHEQWPEVAVNRLMEDRIVDAFQDIVRIANAKKISLREAAYVLAIIRIVNAELARHPGEWSEKLRGQRPYDLGGMPLELDPETLYELQAVETKEAKKKLLERVDQLQDLKINSAALEIAQRKPRVVLIGGLRASGKHGVMEKLAKILEGSNLKPRLMDLQYAKPKDIRSALDGKEIFLKNENEGPQAFTLASNEMLVVAGLEALSDEVLALLRPEETHYGIFLYTSPSLLLQGNHVLTGYDIRLMRDILASLAMGSASTATEVIRRWQKNRFEETRHGFETMKNADFFINTQIPYELPFLNRLLGPLIEIAYAWQGKRKRSGFVPKVLARFKKILEDIPVWDQTLLNPDSLLRHSYGLRQPIQTGLKKNPDNLPRRSEMRGAEEKDARWFRDPNQLHMAVSLPIYALRRAENDPGIGKFADLERYFKETLLPTGIQMAHLLPHYATLNDSPYAAVDRHAPNELYIDWTLVPELQASPDLLRMTVAFASEHQRVNYKAVRARERAIALMAFRLFKKNQMSRNTKRAQAFQEFKERVGKQWSPDAKTGLNDYAEFMALHEMLPGKRSFEWTANEIEKEKAKPEFQELFELYQFNQWVAGLQLGTVVESVSQMGGKLLFDMPMFCNKDSVEVWKHPEYFRDVRDPHRYPGVVKGDTNEQWDDLALWNWTQLAAEGYQFQAEAYDYWLSYAKEGFAGGRGDGLHFADRFGEGQLESGDEPGRPFVQTLGNVFKKHQALGIAEAFYGRGAEARELGFVTIQEKGSNWQVVTTHDNRRKEGFGFNEALSWHLRNTSWDPDSAKFISFTLGDLWGDPEPVKRMAFDPDRKKEIALFDYRIPLPGDPDYALRAPTDHAPFLKIQLAAQTPKGQDIRARIWDHTAEITATLLVAGRSFVRKARNRTEIWAASFGNWKRGNLEHWFLEQWGRDTFISMPGLLFTTGRFEEAKEIFRNFAGLQKDGLIPNRIPQDGNAEYNNADGSLWFIQAVKQYYLYTHDRDFLKEMLPALQKIVGAYQRGTGYDYWKGHREIRMDPADHLIISPAQATWMDADPDGKGAVTPRDGKAVEINALWYAALKFTAEAEKEQGQEQRAKDHTALAGNVRTSFNEKFWNKAFEQDRAATPLFDVIEGDPHSAALRPNMLFAISAGEDLLPLSRQQAVLESVNKDLLTPTGLRTLSPRDSHYHGRYNTEDSPEIKDQAYHQGTIWPWLIGPYVDALVRVRVQEKKDPVAIQNEIRHVLKGLVTHLMFDSPIGSIPELFEGDLSRRTAGPLSQAWSVAEVMRVISEYGISSFAPDTGAKMYQRELTAQKASADQARRSEVRSFDLGREVEAGPVAVAAEAVRTARSEARYAILSGTAKGQVLYFWFDARRRPVLVERGEGFKEAGAELAANEEEEWISVANRALRNAYQSLGEHEKQQLFDTQKSNKIFSRAKEKRGQNPWIEKPLSVRIRSGAEAAYEAEATPDEIILNLNLFKRPEGTSVDRWPEISQRLLELVFVHGLRRSLNRYAPEQQEHDAVIFQRTVEYFSRSPEIRRAWNIWARSLSDRERAALFFGRPWAKALAQAAKIVKVSNGWSHLVSSEQAKILYEKLTDTSTQAQSKPGLLQAVFREVFRSRVDLAVPAGFFVETYTNEYGGTFKHLYLVYEFGKGADKVHKIIRIAPDHTRDSLASPDASAEVVLPPLRIDVLYDVDQYASEILAEREFLARNPKFLSTMNRLNAASLKERNGALEKFLRWAKGKDHASPELIARAKDMVFSLAKTHPDFEQRIRLNRAAFDLVTQRPADFPQTSFNYSAFYGAAYSLEARAMLPDTTGPPAKFRVLYNVNGGETQTAENIAIGEPSDGSVSLRWEVPMVQGWVHYAFQVERNGKWEFIQPEDGRGEAFKKANGIIKYQQDVRGLRMASLRPEVFNLRLEDGMPVVDDFGNLQVGTFDDLIEQLQSLKGQGFGEIYLQVLETGAPGEAGPDGSPFSPLSQMRISEKVGGLGGLMRLKEAADRIGIGLSLDMIPHTSISNRESLPATVAWTQTPGRLKRKAASDGGLSPDWMDGVARNWADPENVRNYIADLKFFAANGFNFRVDVGHVFDTNIMPDRSTYGFGRIRGEVVSSNSSEVFDLRGAPETEVNTVLGWIIHELKKAGWENGKWVKFYGENWHAKEGRQIMAGVDFPYDPLIKNHWDVVRDGHSARHAILGTMEWLRNAIIGRFGGGTLTVINSHDYEVPAVDAFRSAVFAATTSLIFGAGDVSFSHLYHSYADGNGHIDFKRLYAEMWQIYVNNYGPRRVVNGREWGGADWQSRFRVMEEAFRDNQFLAGLEDHYKRIFGLVQKYRFNARGVDVGHDRVSAVVRQDERGEYAIMLSHLGSPYAADINFMPRDYFGGLDDQAVYAFEEIFDNVNPNVSEDNPGDRMLFSGEEIKSLGIGPRFPLQILTNRIYRLRKVSQGAFHVDSPEHKDQLRDSLVRYRRYGPKDRVEHSFIAHEILRALRNGDQAYSSFKFLFEKLSTIVEEDHELVVGDLSSILGEIMEHCPDLAPFMEQHLVGVAVQDLEVDARSAENANKVLESAPVGDHVMASVESNVSVSSGGMGKKVWEQAVAQAGRGQNAHLVVPMFAANKEEIFKKYNPRDTGRVVTVPFGDGTSAVLKIYEARISGVRVFYLENDLYFNKLKGGEGSAYEGSDGFKLRFARALSLGTLLTLREMNIHAGIIETNDWTTAYVKPYLEGRERLHAGARDLFKDPHFSHTKVFTIVHNGGEYYQGRVTAPTWEARDAMIWNDLGMDNALDHDVLYAHGQTRTANRKTFVFPDQPNVINPFYTMLVTGDHVDAVSVGYHDRSIDWRHEWEFGKLLPVLQWKHEEEAYTGKLNGQEQVRQQENFLRRALFDPVIRVKMQAVADNPAEDNTYRAFLKNILEGTEPHRAAVEAYHKKETTEDPGAKIQKYVRSFVERGHPAERALLARFVFEIAKPEAKRKLQKKLGLKQNPNAFIYSMLHRLGEQKGHQLLFAEIWDQSRPGVLRLNPNQKIRFNKDGNAVAAGQIFQEAGLEVDMRSGEIRLTSKQEARLQKASQRWNTPWLRAVEVFMLLNPNVQVVIAGSLDKGTDFEWQFNDIRGRFQDQFRFEAYFVKQGVHELYDLIYDGSDDFGMPSLFEPGGLSNQEAAGVGTVRHMTNRDGLKDKAIRRDGFSETFDVFNPVAWLTSATQHKNTFSGKPALWRSIQEEAINQDNRWLRVVRDEYIPTYLGMLGRKPVRDLRALHVAAAIHRAEKNGDKDPADELAKAGYTFEESAKIMISALNSENKFLRESVAERHLASLAKISEEGKDKLVSQLGILLAKDPANVNLQDALQSLGGPESGDVSPSRSGTQAPAKRSEARNANGEAQWDDNLLIGTGLYPAEENPQREKTAHWARINVLGDIILDWASKHPGRLSLKEIEEIAEHELFVRSLVVTGTSIEGLLDRMVAMGLLKKYDHSYSLAEKQEIFAIKTNQIRFIKKSIEQGLQKVQTGAAGASLLLERLIKEYDEAVARWPRFPVEATWPVLKAVALMSPAQQEQLISYMDSHKSQFADITLARTIELMFQKEIPKDWLKKNVPNLMGRAIYYISPETWLAAGGLGRVGQYHTTAVKTLTGNDAQVVTIEPYYPFRMDSNGVLHRDVDYSKVPIPVERLSETPVFEYVIKVKKGERRVPVTVQVFKGRNQYGIECYLIKDKPENEGDDEYYTKLLYKYGPDVEKAATWDEFAEFISKASLKLVKRLEKIRMQEQGANYKPAILWQNDGQLGPLPPFKRISDELESLPEAERAQKLRDDHFELSDMVMDPESEASLANAYVHSTTHTFRNRGQWKGWDFVHGMRINTKWHYLFHRPNGFDASSGLVRASDGANGVAAMHVQGVAHLDPEVRLGAITNGDDLEASSSVYRSVFEETDFQKMFPKADPWDPTPEQMVEEKKRAKTLAAKNPALIALDPEFAKLDPEKMVIGTTGRMVPEKTGLDRAFTDANIEYLVRRGVQVVILGNIQSGFKSREMYEHLKWLQAKVNQLGPGRLIVATGWGIPEQRAVLAFLDAQVNDSDPVTEAAGFSETDAAANGAIEITLPAPEGIFQQQGELLDAEMPGVGNTILATEENEAGYRSAYTMAIEKYKSDRINFATYQVTSRKLSRILNAAIPAAAYLREFGLGIERTENPIEALIRLASGDNALGQSFKREWLRASLLNQLEKSGAVSFSSNVSGPIKGFVATDISGMGHINILAVRQGALGSETAVLRGEDAFKKLFAILPAGENDSVNIQDGITGQIYGTYSVETLLKNGLPVGLPEETHLQVLRVTLASRTAQDLDEKRVTRAALFFDTANPETMQKTILSLFPDEFFDYLARKKEDIVWWSANDGFSPAEKSPHDFSEDGFYLLVTKGGGRLDIILTPTLIGMWNLEFHKKQAFTERAYVHIPLEADGNTLRIGSGFGKIEGVSEADVSAHSAMLGQLMTYWLGHHLKSFARDYGFVKISLNQSGISDQALKASGFERIAPATETSAALWELKIEIEEEKEREGLSRLREQLRASLDVFLSSAEKEKPAVGRSEARSKKEGLATAQRSEMRAENAWPQHEAQKIAVIGTGFVGATKAILLVTDWGHDVTAVDIQPQIVEKLSSGKLTFHANDLQELLTEGLGTGKLKFTTDYAQAIEGREIIFLAVQTPQSETGHANINYLKDSVREIARLIHPGESKIIVGKSTVPPRDTVAALKEVVTEEFKRREIAGEDLRGAVIHFAWEPEFLREGKEVEDDRGIAGRVVIGADDPAIALKIKQLYAYANPDPKHARTEVPMILTDLISAPLIKYAANGYRSIKISYINFISWLAEELHLNIDKVAHDIATRKGSQEEDRRIGRAFLSAGLGFGGSCFPKDLAAAVQISRGLEVLPGLVLDALAVNELQWKRFLEKRILPQLQNVQGKTIVVLGASFKPGTDDIREARAVKIISKLLERGAKIRVYDPAAVERLRDPQTGPFKDDTAIEYYSAPSQLNPMLENADAVILATEWPDFGKIDFNSLRHWFIDHKKKLPSIFDGRNFFDEKKVNDPEMIGRFGSGLPEHEKNALKFPFFNIGHGQSEGTPLVVHEEFVERVREAFLALRISYINMIAELAERVGANIRDVQRGLGLDFVVGKEYLAPGIGWGGNKLSVSLETLENYSAQHLSPQLLRGFQDIRRAIQRKFEFPPEDIQNETVPVPFITTVRQINDQQISLYIEKAKKAAGGDLHGKVIAVLGLAYKPGEYTTYQSRALNLIEALLKEGAIVRATDADQQAVTNARRELVEEMRVPDLENLTLVLGGGTAQENAREAVRGSDLQFLVTASSAFMDVIPIFFDEKGLPVARHSKMVDGRHFYDPSDLEKHGIEYFAVGAPLPSAKIVRSETRAGEPARQARGKGIEHVLIVDDFDDARFISRLLLEKWAAEQGKELKIKEASSAEEALKILEEQQRTGETPELVLTDRQMPGMSGPKLAQTIHEKGIPVKVILVTSVLPSEEDMEMYRERLIDTGILVGIASKMDGNEIKKLLNQAEVSLSATQRSETRAVSSAAIPTTMAELIKANVSLGGGQAQGFEGVTRKLTDGIYSMVAQTLKAPQLVASFFFPTAQAQEAFDIALVPTSVYEQKRFTDARKVLLRSNVLGDSDVLILAPGIGVDLGAALLMRKIVGDTPVAVLVRNDTDRKFLDQINGKLRQANRPVIFAAATLTEAKELLRNSRPGKDVRTAINVKPMISSTEQTQAAALLLDQYKDAVITVTPQMFKNLLNLAGVSEILTRLRDEYLATARAA